MSGRLEGKVAIITGTGDGQGRTAALRFAAEGAKVVGCDINEETAAETLELVRNAGGEMECLYPLDLTDDAQAKELIDFTVRTFGGVDILYNNAFQLLFAPFESLSVEDWNFSVDHTLTLYILPTKHAIQAFRERGGGAIVNTASVAGLQYGVGSGFIGNQGQTITYSILKAGVLRMTTALAIELSPLNVRVNSISPGPIQIPKSIPLFGSEDAPLRKPYQKQLLLNRLGYPEDIANAALYLASDEASFVTGNNIIVDGGWAAGGGLGQPDHEIGQIILDTFGESVNYHEHASRQSAAR